MNITLIPSDCKTGTQVLCPLSTEEYQKLYEMGVISHKSRSYRLEFQYKDIIIECPIILNGQKPVGVIMPAFKFPYRHYPCFVYLYAVALYLANTSTRKAALKTKTQFGLEKFSHTTILRVLHALLPKVENLTRALDVPVAAQAESPSSVSGRWDDEISTKKSEELSKALMPVLANPKEYGVYLVYKYFMKYCCLLF